MKSNEYVYEIMGGNVKLVLYNLEKEISDIISEDVFKELVRLVKIFNFFDDYSELSLLNKHRKKDVSPELLEVLKKSLEYCKISRGAYDISLGKNILERKQGKNLSRINCSYRDILIKGKKVILNSSDAMIDLGSVAKGYIGDRISYFLKKAGVKSFFIDLRGDLLCYGKYAERVGIMSPREGVKIPFVLRIKNRAIATSGDYNQFWEDYSQSHILNKKDLISVTVVAKTLLEADLFASVVFVSSKKEREKIISKMKKYAVYTIDSELNKKDYNNFMSYINNEKQI